MPVIETIDLTKNYGKARGISALNLCVEEEFFGFIGPNGAATEKEKNFLIFRERRKTSP